MASGVKCYAFYVNDYSDDSMLGTILAYYVLPYKYDIHLFIRYRHSFILSLFISLLPTIKSPCMLKTTMMKMMTNPTKDSLSLHKSTICVLPNQINQSVIFFYLLILSLCAVFTIRGSAQENQSGVCW